MCPLYPLHLIFSWGFLVLFVWVFGGQTLASSIGGLGSTGALGSLENGSNGTVVSSSYSIGVLFENRTLTMLDLNEEETKYLTLFVDDLPPQAVAEILMKEESDDHLSHLQISPDAFPLTYDSVSEQFRAENVSVGGAFVGFSRIKLTLSSDQDGGRALVQREAQIKVKVYHENSLLDKIFVYTIVILVMLTYVNMGCAINIDVISATLRRPVAPAIGLASQYLFMPLVSYGIGYLLFSNTPVFWLGLFLTGCAPGGGASNMWTYILGGSLDLSITMTFLSTIMAFATLPLWVFALGPTIFAEGYFGKLPYFKIAMIVFSLVVPCGLGLCIRRWCPRGADILKKMIKPICIFFIVFVMSFGVYIKFYLFSFFTWKVALAGFLLPFFGFAFGGGMSVLMKRPWDQAIAISIETGVQNTGLAIGVLKIALHDFSPLDDISLILPVAVATMTPVPLLLAWTLRHLFKNRRCSRNGEAICADVEDVNPKLRSNNNSNVYVPIP